MESKTKTQQQSTDDAPSKEFFRSMAMSDVLSHQRALNALREKATSELINRITKMDNDELFKAIGNIDSAKAIENYLEILKIQNPD